MACPMGAETKRGKHDSSAWSTGSAKHRHRHRPQSAELTGSPGPKEHLPLSCCHFRCLVSRCYP